VKAVVAVPKAISKTPAVGEDGVTTKVLAVGFNGAQVVVG
jgi:hypothetical protein